MLYSLNMAASRQLRKLLFSLSPGNSNRSKRAFSAAAAMAAHDYEYWELPPPVVQDTHGQRTGRGPQWIFLGSPGIGKATYASRLARILNVPHISMGNLLRKEASMSTVFSKELVSLMSKGMLVPDDLIFSILSKRLERQIDFEGAGFIFDGFPRTINQAELLNRVAEIDLVVNMKLREDICARHTDSCYCSECGCDLDDTRGNSQSCPECKAIAHSGATMVGRINFLRERQRMYSAQCKPVEHYYCKQGRLLDFEVVGGIPQTWPRLLSALQLEDNESSLQHQLPM